MDTSIFPATPIAISPKRQALVLLGWLVLLTFLHGLLYLAIVPPWQHYDEPTHFEYVRLVALWDRRPAKNEIDLATNREIADSMYRFSFWQPGVRPNLFGAESPNIGFSEKVHPPLYYALAAIPVRSLRFLPIEDQLYAARMVAVMLYVLVVVCAWRVAVVLAPERLSLQIAVPLTTMLVPAFADQMSAVNNDALVNFGTSALLLGCVWLIRAGSRPTSLVLAVLGLTVAVLTKRTALVGVVPFALALLWSLRRQPMRWWIWPALIAGFVLVVGFIALDPWGGWMVRPWLVELDRRYLRLSLDQLVASLFDWGNSNRNYALFFDVLFSSFWMHFGWGNIQLAWGWVWIMRAVVLVGIVGLFVAGLQPHTDSEHWQRRIVWLFVATVLVAWLAAVVRFEAEQSNYIPRGRYVHLAIVPTIWLLVLGFERLTPRRWRVYSLLGLVLFFVLIDTVAWLGTLSVFFYG